MRPLSLVQHTAPSKELGKVLHCVGVFLRNDGKSEQAAVILAKAVDNFSKLNGREDSYTLRTISDLAWTYQEQGRWTDAAKLEEEVLDTRKRKLGEEHPYTLVAMVNLADT